MQQLQNQLRYKARQVGQFSHPSPRKEPELKFSGPPHKLYEPEQGHRSDEGQGYPIEERVMDMPHVSPRKPYPQQDSNTAVRFNDENKESNYWQQERYFGPEARPRDDDSVDYRGDRGRSRFRDQREKYQWYNERKISPPLEMRRSRSLSPTGRVGDLFKDLDQVQE